MFTGAACKAVGKNTKVSINFQKNYANCVLTLGLDVNKRFFTLPLSANEARHSSALYRFVMIISQVNRFYAVIPD